MRNICLYCSLALQLLALSPINAVAQPVSNHKGLVLATQASPDAENAKAVENQLISTLIALSQGRIHAALQSVDVLIAKAPNFKLAHLIRGDLLMALAQQDSISQSNHSPAVQAEIKNYRDEARKRLEHYFDLKKPRGIPDILWQLDMSTPYVLVVDAAKSRLYLYRNQNGTPVYMADYYVTLGKNGIDKQVQGDKRTPIGVYKVGSRLKRELPDLYGEMAFPLSYPNEWDAHQRKTGSGIWLHGTPRNTYSRPPQDSDGCVVMSNADLRTLEPILQPSNALIIVAHDLSWPNTSQVNSQKSALLQAIETWRRDWESKKTNQYLTHYSPNFFSVSTDFAGWAAHKRLVQANSAKLEIKLSKVSVLRYPDSKSRMAVVTFEQQYRTDGIDSRVQKRQYWVLENARWKILYEGPG